MKEAVNTERQESVPFTNIPYATVEKVTKTEDKITAS